MREYKVIDNGILYRDNENTEWTVMSMPQVINYICTLQAELHGAEVRAGVLAEELVEVRRWGQEKETMLNKKSRCLNTIVGTLKHYSVIA